MDVIEISMKLEEQFGITLPDEAWDGVQTVADVYSTLPNLLPLTIH